MIRIASSLLAAGRYAALLVSVAVLSPVYASPSTTLPIEGGAIAVSAARPDGITVIKGLPYAAPPVGNLRWRAPQLVLPWAGVRSTEHFGADCMQLPSEASPPTATRSEDCLYLNVWTPARLGATAAKPLPVFVWIHGGGSQFGSGAQPQFDGSALAKKGIVVVTINYRLGVFGFISSNALSAESGYGASGNYGFMDDIAALRWLQRNVAAFGGDPHRITIGGESSGSVSTGTLMASPLAADLFQRVIGESGSVFRLAGNGSMGATTLAPEEAKGNRLFSSLGVKTLADARALPAARVLAAAYTLAPGDFFNLPVVDGYLLPDAPARVFAAHHQNDVPLLVGWNSGEGSMELMIYGSLGTLPERLSHYYGASAPQIAPYYPAATADDMAVLLKVAGDNGFGYPNWAWGAAQQRSGTAPVFVYQFDHAPPIAAGYFGPKFDTKWAGAFHGAEISYVFDTLDSQPLCAVTAEDHRIAAQISLYWANFIIAGDPNSKTLPRWPAYDPAHGPQRMQLGLETGAFADPDYARFVAIKAVHDRIDPPEPAPPRALTARRADVALP